MFRTEVNGRAPRGFSPGRSAWPARVALMAMAAVLAGCATPAAWIEPVERSGKAKVKPCNVEAAGTAGERACTFGVTVSTTGKPGEPGFSCRARLVDDFAVVTYRANKREARARQVEVRWEIADPGIPGVQFVFAEDRGIRFKDDVKGLYENPKASGRRFSWDLVAIDPQAAAYEALVVVRRGNEVIARCQPQDPVIINLPSH